MSWPTDDRIKEACRRRTGIRLLTTKCAEDCVSRAAFDWQLKTVRWLLDELRDEPTRDPMSTIRVLERVERELSEVQ